MTEDLVSGTAKPLYKNELEKVFRKLSSLHALLLRERNPAFQRSLGPLSDLC